METASLSIIKKELKNLAPEELQTIVTRLAKYKKENKELLNYLLFEAIDEQAFIRSVKEEIDEQFLNLNRGSSYLGKKTLRKVLRTTNKYIKFSGLKETEIELRIYFCKKIKSSRLNYQYNRVVFNMYTNQIKRINKVLSMLHEDIQFDYEEEVQALIQ